MSRRHNAARRRNYGRRQHEVRERRSDTRLPGDWQNHLAVNEVAVDGLTVADDWHVTDLDDEHPSAKGPDGYGGAQL